MIRKTNVFALGITASLLISLVSGCTTPYQSEGFTGGYSETQLAEDRYMVSFRGNGYTGLGTVELYLIYRCAELTDWEGFDYFIIEESNIQEKHGSIDFPGTYSGQTNFQAHTYGNYMYGTATTSGTYSSPTSIPYTKYSKTAIIRMYHGDTPREITNAFDAHYIIKNVLP